MDLVRRLLSSPDLLQAVPRLDAGTAGALLRRVGLEDSAALVALLTPAQLEAVLDDELWGADEAFDAARWLTWLEVMFEHGDAFVVARLAAQPEDALALAIHHAALVLDADELDRTAEARAPAELARIEAALESLPAEQLEGWLVLGRRHEGWDALLAALLALDVDHHDLVDRVLTRASTLARDEIAETDDGLSEVLSAAESALEDAREARDRRRRGRGFVARADAIELLEGLRRARVADLVARPRRGAFEAYRRRLEPVDADPAALAQALSALAAERPDRARLAASVAPSPLQTRLAALRARDPAAHAEATEALVFCANVLLGAGAASGPAEAAQAVLRYVDAGEARLGPSVDPLHLFEVGYALETDDA